MKPGLIGKWNWQKWLGMFLIALSIWLALILIINKAVFGDGLLDPKWAEDWDTVDKLIGAGYTYTWFHDFGQTRMIAENPDKWYELNPTLGKHPSVGTVNTYFLSSYMFNFFVANQLGEIKQPWGSILRKSYLLKMGLIHYKWMKHNEDVGLSISFNLAIF